ncbi:MAG: hypothetical protein KGH98_04545 [Candidatus Micrarchaeota archaeon]|nr:hypothetical protein [Candidatus Micrarchaeota archaeon]
MNKAKQNDDYQTIRLQKHTDLQRLYEKTYAGFDFGFAGLVGAERPNIFGDSYDDKVCGGALRNIRSCILDSLSSPQPFDVLRNKGTYELGVRGAEAALTVGEIFARIIETGGALSLSTKTEDLMALTRTLTKAVMRLELNIVAPVCPDYGKGEHYYSEIGDGLGAEARGAVDASKLISKTFENLSYGIQIRPKIDILVADTEDDIREIIHRVSNGDLERYKDSCSVSSEKIEKQLAGMYTSAFSSTFSKFLGAEFRHAQYQYQHMLYRGMALDTNKRLNQEIVNISKERAERHAQILGREEINYELTVRYIAQYAALGSLVRNMDYSPRLLLNYRTPNLEYFNIGRDYGLLRTDKDEKTVPVLTYNVDRGK